MKEKKEKKLPKKTASAGTRKTSLKKEVTKQASVKKSTKKAEFKDLQKTIPKKGEEKKKGSLLESKRIIWSIFFLLLLMLVFIIFNFFSLLKTRKELKQYLETARQADEAISKGNYDDFFNKESDSESDYSLEKIVPGWRSFGDNFSSSAYLDKNKTNLFLDDVVTSLTFPPIIEIEKVENFVESDNDWIYTNEKNSCQFAPRNKCLRVVNEKEIFYNNRKIDLPREMWLEEIKKIDISFLSTKYVVSFSVAHGDQERMYSYFFDGNRYRVLIGKDSSEKIITEYGRPGGVMVAGGSDDDFILLYSGYESKAFHYKNGKLFNISRFFGLRVSDEDFYPYIIKQGEGRESVWYILNLNDSKKRLIKLWQNNSEEIKGAIDLSYNFKDFSGLKIKSFRLSREKKSELEFVFVKDENTVSPSYLKEEGVWVLKDKGFDNSVERKAVSINLNYSRGEISSAYFNEIFFESDISLANIYLFSQEDEMIEARPKEKIIFPDKSTNLQWQVIFRPAEYSEYSPWLDHINDLKYFLTGRS